MASGLKGKLNMLSGTAPKVKIDAQPETIDCYINEKAFPLNKSLFNISPHTLRFMCGESAARNWDPKRALFIDTETTGLSGGAGTLAFLVGVGFIKDDSFVVRQYLMRDYSEEPIMLSKLKELLCGFDTLVSFNGKSFDIPLLESRFIMTRMRAELSTMPHCDLLHTSRRVWKMRLANCSLGNLEKKELGITRIGDIPGSEIPQIYFDYIKTKNFKLLEPVLAHNCQDIATLMELMCRLHDVFERPVEQTSLLDIYSVGKAMEKHGNYSAAKKCYRAAGANKEMVSARLSLSMLMKRERETTEAANLWNSMVKCNEGGLVPIIELAKHCEHTLKDYKRAIELIECAIAISRNMGDILLPEILKRRSRLLYKYKKCELEER